MQQQHTHKTLNTKLLTSDMMAADMMQFQHLSADMNSRCIYTLQWHCQIITRMFLMDIEGSPQ